MYLSGHYIYCILDPLYLPGYWVLATTVTSPGLNIAKHQMMCSYPDWRTGGQ